MAASRKSRIRIIGGKWRGRRLEVVDGEGLQPTPDRVRETLFNWLAPYCPGARVLDCFAGSGVLGLEALSRGARGLVALEKQAAALESLRLIAAQLEPEAIEIVGGDAQVAIAALEGRFDLVFIDPPYARPELRRQLFRELESRGLGTVAGIPLLTAPRPGRRSRRPNRPPPHPPHVDRPVPRS